MLRNYKSLVLMLYAFASANGSVMSRQPISAAKNMPPATVKVVRFGLVFFFLPRVTVEMLIATHLPSIS